MQRTLPADVEIAARLRLALTRLARRLRQEGDPDVTPSQLSALASINALGPVTLGELAAVERVQPPTMTRVVSALEEAGLVLRRVDPTDRRVARVELTAAARRLLDRNRRRKDEYLASRVRRLSPDDRELLARAAGVLERLVEEEQ